MLLLTTPSQLPFFTLLIKALGYKKDEVAIITNKEDLQEALKSSIAEDVCILIETSLNWNNQSEASFYGFEVAADLRRVHGLRNPIGFLSFFEPIYFETLGKTDTKYHILYGSGSYHIRYPFQPNHLKELMAGAKSIDAATLHDVVTMLCDLKGIVIDKLNHRLIFEYGQAVVQNALADAAPFVQAWQKQLIGWDGFADQLAEAINKNDRLAFRVAKEMLLKACTLHLTQLASTEEASTDKKYKILLLDDRPNELEHYANRLAKDFIVEKASRSEDAISILNNDSGNSIMAVISDWRLFESDKLTFWQPLQGYEVLGHSARTGIRALFALTSQADYVVHHIRNLLGINFSMFKKENIATEDQWQLFRSILLEACAANAAVISSIPSGGGWKNIDEKKKDSKSLHQQYLEKRNSPEWTIYQQNITNRSNMIWSYYDKSINGTLKEVRQDFAVKFGIELKGNLEGVLIARRVCMGLLFNQGKIYQNILGNSYPKIDAFCYFKNTSFEVVIEELDKKGTDLKGQTIEQFALAQLKTNSSGLINTTLCIDKDFASGKDVLPEERNWIAQKGFEMDLDLYDEEDFFEEEEKIKSKEIAADEAIKKKIEKGPTAKELKGLENIHIEEDSDDLE